MVVPPNLPFSQSLLIGWFLPAAGRVGSLEEGGLWGWRGAQGEQHGCAGCWGGKRGGL